MGGGGPPPDFYSPDFHLIFIHPVSIRLISIHRSDAMAFGEPKTKSKLSRRDLLQGFAKGAAVSCLCGLEALALPLGRQKTSEKNAGKVYSGSDEQLLEEIERAAFDFFWNEANPATGQIRDRGLADESDNRSTFSSIASTGFGLTALCIGDRRNYLPTAQIRARVIACLEFLLHHVPHEHGFFYHFIDINTGQRFGNCELSTIDTSILLCGIMSARQHFQDRQISDLANQIYERMDWPWFLNGGTTFSMGWKPKSGFLHARWDHYCELMMIYLLALGSPTHPVAPETWKAWSRPMIEYQGIRYIYGDSPLFVHQYSHAWFDFRKKRDDFANYYENSIRATQAHKLFCLSLHDKFSDYAENLWGISS